MVERKRTAILISGRGSNMARLIDAAAERDFPAEIVAVISDKPDVQGLAIARARSVPTHVVERKDFAGKEAHDGAIDAVLAAVHAEIVCLAGYMRLLTTPFVEKWRGRMINIHPALLPLFKGLDTHRRAIEAGVLLHGATVHFVTPETDCGPSIVQAAVPVLPDDAEDTLAARVLKAEHEIYPMALRMLAEGRVRMESDRSVFSGRWPAGQHDVAMIVSPPRAPEPEDIERLARFTP